MREASARCEILLACVAVKTPQLLMLSGIGAADQLRTHHLPVVVDSPVGEGLHDHPRCLTGWRTPAVRNLWKEITPENLERWPLTRRGPMASFGAEVGGFAPSTRAPAPWVVMPRPSAILSYAYAGWKVCASWTLR